MVTPTLFLPGHECGGEYSIVRAHSRSLASESYVARHKQTRRQVILTCSRFAHCNDGSPESTRFLTQVAELRRLSISGSTKVLDGGIDGDIYWVAREHDHEIIPLADFLKGTGDVATEYLEALREVLKVGPYVTFTGLILAVGLSVADTMGMFAKEGILHGGLDPRRTVALRGDCQPVVLEAGYASLFRHESSASASSEYDVRSPEQKAGGAPDVRSDIYSLGLILGGMLTSASRAAKHPADLKALVLMINRALERDPKDRFQSWGDFYSALLVFREKMFSRGEGILKAGLATLAAANGSSLEAAESGMRLSAAKEQAIEKGAVKEEEATPTLRPLPLSPEPTAEVSARISVTISSSFDAPPTPRVPEMPEWTRTIPAPAPIGPAKPVPAAASEGRRARWAALGATAALVCAIEGALHLAPSGRALEAVPTIRGAPVFILVQAGPEAARADGMTAMPGPSSDRSDTRTQSTRSPSAPRYGGPCTSWANCRMNSPSAQNATGNR